MSVAVELSTGIDGTVTSGHRSVPVNANCVDVLLLTCARPTYTKADPAIRRREIPLNCCRDLVPLLESGRSAEYDNTIPAPGLVVNGLMKGYLSIPALQLGIK